MNKRLSKYDYIWFSTILLPNIGLTYYLVEMSDSFWNGMLFSKLQLTIFVTICYIIGFFSIYKLITLRGEKK